MRAHLRRPSIILALAFLLGVLLFLFDIARPDIHLWARYLLPVVVVFLWGRRRDLYIVSAFMSLLILASYWLDPSASLEDAFVNHLVPVVVLWVIAWLFSQHMQMHAKLLHQQQALAEQVTARTADLQARTAELQASEQRYRLLAESASDVVTTLDLQGNPTYISPSAARMVGVAAETLVAMTPQERQVLGLDPLTLPAVRDALAAVRAGQPVDPRPVVVALAGAGGAPTWTETHITALLGEDGVPVGLRTATRNVTLRHQAEEALRRSEDRFAKIFRASPAGILLRREADGCVLDCNDAYQQVTGYSYDEIIGHPIAELGIVTPALTDNVTAMLQEQGHIDGMDIQIVNKAGETLDVSCSVERVEFGGEPCHLVIGFDIGERKRMERELRRLNEELEERVAYRTADLQAALDELQRAGKLKDEFMAMISHELRTPLSGVLSMAELLQDQIAGPLNPRQALYVQAIEQSGQRLFDVVTGILSYTYLVSGHMQLQPERCELAYLLNVCAVSQRVKADAKQQTLQVLVEPPDLSVETDPAAVAEVVKRLLDNAIKFTPTGGQIGLEAHAGPLPGTLQLAVWDTGSGIAAGEFERILQPFTQGDAGLARGHEGIGMGLAYVQRMLSLLGGQLALEPNAPSGSRLIVTLPAAQADGAVRAQRH